MNLAQFVYAAVFGVLLAYVTNVTGSIAGAIAAHMAANLTSTLYSTRRKSPSRSLNARAKQPPVANITAKTKKILVALEVLAFEESKLSNPKKRYADQLRSLYADGYMRARMWFDPLLIRLWRFLCLPAPKQFGAPVSNQQMDKN